MGYMIDEGMTNTGVLSAKASFSRELGCKSLPAILLTEGYERSVGVSKENLGAVDVAVEFPVT